MPKRKSHAIAAKPKKSKKEDDPEEIDPSSGEGIKDVGDAPSSSGDDDAYPSEDEADGESSDDDEDGEAFDSIDVDFEFVDPAEEDFHGLKTLLNNFLDGKQFSCSELVEAIIDNSAGSVIKCGEGEDAIGVTSVLPLHAHTAPKFLKELKSYLAQHCPKKVAKELETSFSSPTSALLVSERLLNCPPQLAPPLMESLMKEAKEIVKSGTKINQYIFITRAYADPTSGASKEGKKKAAKGAEAAKSGSLKVQDLIFSTPEGEFLSNKASLAFSYPVPNRAVAKDDLRPYRVVAVVPAKEVPAALKEMAEVLEGSA